MGKNLQHQNTNISLENGNPGCMYSVFHVLHRQRWHRVRKMLPHKRHGGGKHTSVVADPGGSITPADVSELEVRSDVEITNSPVTTNEARTPVSSPVTKTSMKSRIKAFVTEEMSKRRVRHRRCSSYPARLSRTNSIHHLELSDMDPLPEISSNENSSHQSNSENSSIKKRKCDICAAMLTMSYLKQSNINEHEKQLKDNTVIQKNIEKPNQDSLKENQDASAPETKRLLEALDIFDMRKEFFVKILQDPTSPLGQYLQSREAFNSKKLLPKSISFPVSGSARRRDVRAKDPKSKQEEEKFQVHCQSHKLTENMSIEECNGDGSRKPILTRSESSHELKTRNENKLVMKRFKNLRQKIRHAIKETRKERHRILMDAVFHKVPYGRRSSKYAKDYESLNLKEKSRKHSPASSWGSDQSLSEDTCLRRTASYNETLNRYSRLFDDNFNKEARHHISERVKMTQAEAPSPSRSDRASFGRILSSPDLTASFFFIGEECPSMTPIDNTLNVASKRFNDQKAPPGLSLVQENVSQENLDEVDRTVDKNFETAERAQENIEPPSEMEKPSPVSVLDSNSKEDMSDSLKISVLDDVSVIQQQESLDVQKMETSDEQYHSDFLRNPMEIKDNVEFKYVRDVLTLAGFSGNEFLRAWHYAFQPVDPSVHEEVESGLLPYADLFSGEEGQKSDHLLLFDLINEVLLEIHERLFTYCPKPLTCRSHIHPMPVGYHVLEEVWNNVSWYMRYRPEMDQLLDDAVSRDMARDDGWMNLQFEAECVGIELEDMIFDDLLDELVWSSAPVSPTQVLF